MGEGPSDFYPRFEEQLWRTSESIKIEIEPRRPAKSARRWRGTVVINRKVVTASLLRAQIFPTCNYTKNIEIAAKGCPICGSGLLSHRSKKYKGKLFYTCDKKGSDPNAVSYRGDLPIEGKTCPTCGAYMVLKHYGKKAYPKCSNRDCITNQRKKKDDGDGS